MRCPLLVSEQMLSRLKLTAELSCFRAALANLARLANML